MLLNSRTRIRERRRYQMPRDILSEFGPESHRAGTNSPQASPARDGGVDLDGVVNRRYDPPQGPTRLMGTNGPGLHGVYIGQGQRFSDNDGGCGSPGNHGNNHGN